jgi:Peptidase family C25
MAETDIVFNGVNAATGDYLLPPLSADVVSRVATGEVLDPKEVEELRARYASLTSTYLGVVEGVDPLDLGQAGWGIVFAHGVDPAVRDALKPLIEHRREQASTLNEARFRAYVDADAYRPGESSADFLVRHGVAPGQPANPDKMPYYLLVVGSPEDLPYRFQYQLDVVYAVGRLNFDTPEEYARYAQAVIQAEMGPPPEPTLALFGARNPDDRATTMSADHLVSPLSASLPQKAPAWSFTTMVGDGQATKANLGELLGGARKPTILFSASHGVGFPSGHPQQLTHQGAPLCQDWPGPVQWRSDIPPDFYFSGDDVSDQSNPSGMIAFFFACYGAGTPKSDDFAQQALGAAPQIAPHAFVGRLPQRLLAHPKGGALAVVGHIERAWGYSFMWPRVGEQLETFEGTLSAVMSGKRLGAAIEYFNDRYAALTTELEDEKDNIRYGAIPDAASISGLWTAKNDARNYVILGDPAVRVAAAPRHP